MTLREYIRRRRLSLAAVELQKDSGRVIDIAVKYRYESPTAFTRAFKGFHGIVPSALKTENSHIQAFLPIRFHVSMDGGQTYRKRAAFTLIASSVVHDKKLTDDMLDYYLGLIAKYSDDEREHVKKAASWALREIGKKDFNYNEKALLLAHEFAESDSKALKWIGKDAIKELETLVKAEGRGRLISSKSQMGKEAAASEA